LGCWAADMPYALKKAAVRNQQKNGVLIFINDLFIIILIFKNETKIKNSWPSGTLLTQVADH
jgi:hypothetical protein